MDEGKSRDVVEAREGERSCSSLCFFWFGSQLIPQKQVSLQRRREQEE